MKKIRLLLVCLSLMLAPAPGRAQFGGFGGPSILSRGTGPIGTSGGRPIRLRAFASLSSHYTTGLATPATSGRDDYYGGSIGVGIQGNYNRPRDFFSVSTDGNFRLYRPASGFDGMNYNLALSYGRVLSPRWTLFLSQSGRMRNHVLDTTITPFSEDPLAELPATGDQFFDSGHYALSSAAGFTYRRSARTSFSFSGGAYFSRYSYKGLVGVNGYSGHASVFYLLNARSGLGFSYSYNTYDYLNLFGEGQVGAYSLNYARTLTPRWRMNLRGGVYRVHFVRLQAVALDPFIALLTGQSAVLEVADGRRNGFTGAISVSRRFERSGLTLSYARGVVPGNGVYHTSERNGVSVSHSLTSLRNWNVGFYGTYTRVEALSQTIPDYQTAGGGIGVGRRINSFLHSNFNVGYHHGLTRGGLYDNRRINFSAGLVISPGEVPVSLW